MPWVILETGNSYLLMSHLEGEKRAPGNSSAPMRLTLHKGDFNTRQITASQIVAGDTAQTDSIIVPYSVMAAIAGNRIVVAYNELYTDTSVKPRRWQNLSVVILDTNLNVLSGPKQVKQEYFPANERFAECNLQSLAMHENRILIGYFSNDSIARFHAYSTLTKYLLLDGAGNLLRDSIAGVTPLIDPTKMIQRDLFEVTSYPDNRFLITGNDLHDHVATRTPGFVIADSNMNLLDSAMFVPIDLSTGSHIGGEFSWFANTVVLPGGNLIQGGDFEPGNGTNGPWVGLMKYNSQSGYKVMKKAVFDDSRYVGALNATPSFLNLGYNPRDHRAYYASTDQRRPGYAGPCTGGPNNIQVYCLDTNLNLLWHKFIQPASNRCSYVTRTTVTGSRAGITIFGYYTDTVNAADTSRQGYFLYHLDSTGALDVPSSKLATVRDRIALFPNPATDRVTVNDLAGNITGVRVYNAAGQQVREHKAAAQSEVSLSLGPLPPGLYLIECRTADGLRQTTRVRKD